MVTERGEEEHEEGEEEGKKKGGKYRHDLKGSIISNKYDQIGENHQ